MTHGQHGVGPPVLPKRTGRIGEVAIGDTFGVDAFPFVQIFSHARGGREQATVRAVLSVLIGTPTANVLCANGRAISRTSEFILKRDSLPGASSPQVPAGQVVTQDLSKKKVPVELEVDGSASCVE